MLNAVDLMSSIDEPKHRRRKRRRPSSVFERSSHIRHLADGAIATARFLTARACDHIISLCEAHATSGSTTGCADPGGSGGGWWSRESSSDYAQATNDLEVAGVHGNLDL